VHLTPIEESLMQFLIDHLGELCDRRMLSQAGWPDYASPDQVTDKQYSEAMRLLKKKVNQIAPNALENVPRKGYRLQAPPLGGVSGSENGG
jgi:DNA-binding winged helix-turn-helix (wHTH) protein